MSHRSAHENNAISTRKAGLRWSPLGRRTEYYGAPKCALRKNINLYGFHVDFKKALIV
ncbi:MAG: hypothetical protein RL497_1510 [Pseudomonadota bacterium]|jgi:hypothetical protein